MNRVAGSGRKLTANRRTKTMHNPGLVPLLIILVLAFLLFGRPGRLSGMMEDLGKGIKGFRKGMSEGETPPAKPEEPPRRIVDQSGSSQTTDAQTKTEA
ncbi:MAG TPA: twin-arginine translocase TatA/TatE family subunit [Caulobacterales bacterium]|nr:twin-arginine translocase TatA/TatE family subunit [Caulobacterales bacterium]